MVLVNGPNTVVIIGNDDDDDKPELIPGSWSCPDCSFLTNMKMLKDSHTCKPKPAKK